MQKRVTLTHHHHFLGLIHELPKYVFLCMKIINESSYAHALPNMLSRTTGKLGGQKHATIYPQNVMMIGLRVTHWHNKECQNVSFWLSNLFWKCQFVILFWGDDRTSETVLVDQTTQISPSLKIILPCYWIQASLVTLWLHNRETKLYIWLAQTQN